MVQRKLVWTDKARADRRSIFTYWTKRNKSNSYSQKLSKQFLRAGEDLIENPHLGIKTDLEDFRYVIIENKYLFIYRVTPKVIEVISIWDGRRNPEDFQKIIRIK